MKQTFVQRTLDRVPGMQAQYTLDERKRSYRPVSWTTVNYVLDIVDTLTNGRAGWLQRFFSFAFIGGMAALVNLIVFSCMFYIILAHAPFPSMIRYTIATIIATELSILANFIPNDHFTFRHLPGSRQRSWLARCIRYHLTSVTGALLTYLISFTLTYFVHVPAVVALACAQIVVLFYNFSFHHLFTYRHAKSATAEEADVLELLSVDVNAAEPVPTA